jgi:hypothetical protein
VREEKKIGVLGIWSRHVGQKITIFRLMNLTSISGHEPAMPADSKVFKNMVIVNFFIKNMKKISLILIY